MVKWTTELCQYDIQYEPRTTIKAQDLQDFLAKVVHEENLDPWKIHVDVSACNEGSGVGVVLVSPTATK